MSPWDFPRGMFTIIVFAFCEENKSELFVLWLISDHLTIQLSEMASKDQRHK